jgi:hypothetical protein
MLNPANAILTHPPQRPWKFPKVLLSRDGQWHAVLSQPVLTGAHRHEGAEEKRVHRVRQHRVVTTEIGDHIIQDTQWREHRHVPLHFLAYRW